MSGRAETHELRRPLAITVHAEMGLVEGELLAIGSDLVRFWCREDLVTGTRADIRIDLGPGSGNADIQVFIRKQTGPASGRRRGFGHVGAWSTRNDDQRKRLLYVVQQQLPDVWFAESPTPKDDVSPEPKKPARASRAKNHDTPQALDEEAQIMVAPGPTPTVAVSLPSARALNAALRVRDGRAVVRIGDAGALSAGERVLLVLGLSDGTYHQLQAVVVKTRAGRFVRSDTLAASIRVHLERLLKSAGVSR